MLAKSAAIGDTMAPAATRLADVAPTVERARAVQREWGALPIGERSRHLREVRRRLARRIPELAVAIVADVGKPRVDATLEVAAAILNVEWARRHARRALRPERVPTAPLLTKRAWVEYSPRGVVAVLTPFNYPFGIAFQSLPWALAAGNTIVLKPSERAPRSGALLAETVNSAGLDLVWPVFGEGNVGAAVVDSPVDMVVFTGSVPTGRKIAAAAGRRLVPVVLELGGKDAMVVCDDVDVGRAARVAVGSAFINSGQACMATERALVHTRVHDRFVEEVVRLARTLTVGGGERCHLGPVVDGAQVRTVSRRIAEAVERGARIATGGRPSGLDDRFFDPTILVDVPTDCELFQEESFLPVLSVVRVASDDEAVAIANGVEFGLNGSVLTRSRARARAIGRRLVTGGVDLRDALSGVLPSIPFGGERASGVGRLQGMQGFRAFSRARTIVESRFARAPSSTEMVLRRPDPDRVARIISRIFG